MNPAAAAPAPSFYRLQARHRRSARIAQAICFAMVAVAGLVTATLLFIHVGLVVFAMFFVPAIALLALGFALWAVAGEAVAAPLWSAATAVLDVMSAVLSVPFFAPQSLQLAAIALPTLSWLAVHWVWRRVGSGETLLHLGARAPAPGDLEERQLGNLVAEMAVAAGIPKPKVWLIDGEPPNAAAVGSSTDDAHVVVSRPVIDRLDRAATQAIVGHLVAQVADGDLRLGSTIQAVFYVLELMIVVTLAPFARMPRAIAAQWTAFFLAAPALGGDARKARARELVHALEQHRERFRQGSGMSERQLFRERDYLGRVGSVLVRTCPPLIALLLLGRALSDLLSLFVGIPIALLWRSRRYLADATSVELTRNPRALVAALETLASSDRPLPGSLREAHLFVLGSNRDPEEGTFAARHSIVIGMHPPIARRLARARAMVGA